MVLVRLGAVVVLALVLPLGQLTTTAIVTEHCCCPDPDYCHCPGAHDADPSGAPAMQSCGKASHRVIAPTLSAFVVPPALETAPLVAAPAPASPPRAPHPPPDPDRPAAPS